MNVELERRKSVAVANTEGVKNQLLVNNMTHLVNITRDLEDPQPAENKIQSTPHLEKRINLKRPTDRLNTSITHVLPPKSGYFPQKRKASELKHQPRIKRDLNTSMNRSVEASVEKSLSSKN